jgi:Peptidase family C25
MMKKLILPILLFITVAANAQFNNSWIDYSKTYYKFKVVKDGLYRIPQATLSVAGIGSANADYFQLWRNGQQVRLYTTVSGTALGSSDFISFWGKMNDGEADKQLYRKPEFQQADRHSLETDTSIYFLTVNSNAAVNLRYTNATNAAPSAATPDAFFMRDVDVYYKSLLNRGFGQYAGEYVYSASYDNGEGFTSNEITSTVSDQNVLALGQYTENFTDLNVYTAGPANSLSVRARMFLNTGNNSRRVGIKLFNNTILADTTSAGAHSINVNRLNLPLSFLTNPNTADLNFTIRNLGVFTPPPPTIPPTPPNYVPNERMVLATVGLSYPATFNFNNKKVFEFNLAASATGNYLVIDNFNYGTAAPILYDINNGRRYVGDITSTPGKVKFVLPSSTDPVRKFSLINEESVNYENVGSLLSKTFVNYNTAATRGDYIIISNPVLYNDGTGANPVDAYKAYRSSANGGSYNAKVYDINELRDQFAFGIPSHPAAIKDFVKMMDAQYPIKPKFVFLIGRGLSYDDRRRIDFQTPSIAAANIAIANKLDMLPTFGWPASDVLMVSSSLNPIQTFPVGRLGAITGAEVKVYLQKVTEYDAELKRQSPLVAEKSWMKNILQIAGGRDSYEQNTFNYYMDSYRDIALSDTLFGGDVEKFRTYLAGQQSSADLQLQSEKITKKFEDGLGLISYFGHSAATSLEFNMGNPELYNNPGKYPFFNISGCNAGNYYSFDPSRISVLSTLSEKYLFTPQRGSIGFLANTHFGIPGDLFEFDTRLYRNFSQLMYGKSIGEQTKEITSNLNGNDANLWHQRRVHLEEINLHGDPAIKINNFDKPDYAIEAQLVKITPAIISVTDPFFTIKIKMHNLGRAIKDSMHYSVKRLRPNTTVPEVVGQGLLNIKYADSLTYNLPINPNTDAGINKITIELDDTQLIPELYETNNGFSSDIVIFENALNPIMPYIYSIVNTQNITFSASTANALLGQTNFVMELDTTELFNSAFKKVYNKTAVGGLIEFTPTNLTFTDSTVYYWRTAAIPAVGATIWNKSSFVYLANSTAGFNQSHYYQHLKSTGTFLNYTNNGIWKFPTYTSYVSIKNGVFPTAAPAASDASITIDGFNTIQALCGVGKVIINSFNPSDMQAVFNNFPGGVGQFGSDNICGNAANPGRQFNFQYSGLTTAGRNAARDYLDLIPNGYYVIFRNVTNANFGTDAYAATWQADGANSLYSRLKNAGFADLDSFNRPRAFNFMYKKSDNSFTPVSNFSEGIYDKINLLLTCNATKSSGILTSPLFGPAKSWDALHWRGKSVELPNTDSIYFNIIGVDNAGNETTLFTIDSTQKDFSLSSVNAAQYPFIKLKMNVKDKANATPYQLNYWRINYTPLPEGAIAPNIAYTMKDTVELGEPIDFSVAFKNVSGVKFDNNMKINLRIRNNANVDNVITIPRGKILLAGDTIKASYKIPSENYLGNNTLFVEFNGNNDQPEQYYPNNYLFKNFYVKDDKVNPLLDVTFDGVHILNSDIVSAKPDILIKLNDDSKYLGLTDNSLLTVKLKYENETARLFNFNTDTLQFTPANLAAGENTAKINFKPYLLRDGQYELIVTGKDRSGNRAGAIEYHITFKVINKAMISEMLNYPNPFTTSTAFVFTLTGSQVPQNIKIQVLTVTGKVVREITKDELGPLHIGRNVTTFKWDGTDMYGQALANGVYIYRVVTNLNGNKLDKYKAKGDDTEKYFDKGYGKMYLMR